MFKNLKIKNMNDDVKCLNQDEREVLFFIAMPQFSLLIIFMILSIFEITGKLSISTKMITGFSIGAFFLTYYTYCKKLKWKFICFTIGLFCIGFFYFVSDNIANLFNSNVWMLWSFCFLFFSNSYSHIRAFEKYKFKTDREKKLLEDEKNSYKEIYKQVFDDYKEFIKEEKEQLSKERKDFLIFNNPIMVSHTDEQKK